MLPSPFLGMFHKILEHSSSLTLRPYRSAAFALFSTLMFWVIQTQCRVNKGNKTQRSPTITFPSDRNVLGSLWKPAPKATVEAVDRAR